MADPTGNADYVTPAKRRLDVTDACDVLNLALQDAPEIGHEYGYGDLAVDLLAALREAGYKVLLRSCSCSCVLCTVLPEPDFEVVFEDD